MVAGYCNPCEVKTPEAKFRFQVLFKSFLFPHLKLLHFLLGGLVGNVDGVWGRDGLLGQSQPSIQVVVLLHKLMPEQPSPLQPGRNMHKVRSFQPEKSVTMLLLVSSANPSFKITKQFTYFLEYIVSIHLEK